MPMFRQLLPVFCSQHAFLKYGSIRPVAHPNSIRFGSLNTSGGQNSAEVAARELPFPCQGRILKIILATVPLVVR